MIGPPTEKLISALLNSSLRVSRNTVPVPPSARENLPSPRKEFGL